jgi:hypothetical protein
LSPGVVLRLGGVGAAARSLHGGGGAKRLNLAEAAEVLKQEPGRDFERTVSTDSRWRVELAKACGVAVSPKENGPRERPVSV